MRSLFVIELYVLLYSDSEFSFRSEISKVEFFVFILLKNDSITELLNKFPGFENDCFTFRSFKHILNVPDV